MKTNEIMRANPGFYIIECHTPSGDIYSRFPVIGWAGQDAVTPITTYDQDALRDLSISDLVTALESPDGSCVLIWDDELGKCCPTVREFIELCKTYRYAGRSDEQ